MTEDDRRKRKRYAAAAFITAVLYAVPAFFFLRPLFPPRDGGTPKRPLYVTVTLRQTADTPLPASERQERHAAPAASLPAAPRARQRGGPPGQFFFENIEETSGDTATAVPEEQGRTGQPAAAQDTGQAVQELFAGQTRLPGTGGADTAAEKAARNEFLRLLDEAINAALVYPEKARRRGTEGTVTLRIETDGSGTLLMCSVAESSGSAVLDSAAEKLAKSVFPLPASPQAPFSALIRISYRLNRTGQFF